MYLKKQKTTKLVIKKVYKHTKKGTTLNLKQKHISNKDS